MVPSGSVSVRLTRTGPAGIARRVGLTVQTVANIIRELEGEQTYGIVEQVRKLNLLGVGFIPESARQYPAGALAGSLVGAVGDELAGAYGVGLVTVGLFTTALFVTQQVDPTHPALAATVPKIRALAGLDRGRGRHQADGADPAPRAAGSAPRCRHAATAPRAGRALDLHEPAQQRRGHDPPARSEAHRRATAVDVGLRRRGDRRHHLRRPLTKECKE